MQKLALLFSASLAASLAAQCNPGTVTTGLAGGNQGNTGGGIYFDLTITQTITITDINFRAGPTGTGGTDQMRVYMGPSTWVGNVTNPGLWTEVRQTAATAIVQNATAANPGILTPGQLVDPVSQLPSALTLGPGSYGIALQSRLNVFNHGYSNTPPGPWSSPGNELTITTGAAQNAFLSGGVFTPRHWNGEIVYTCGGTPIAVASSENFGSGCYGYNTSFHELFPNPIGLDVANQTVALNANLGQSSYDVAPGATPYTAPTGSATLAAPGAGLTTFSVATLLGGALPFPIFYPRGGSLGIATDLEVCHAGYVTPVDPLGVTAPLPGANVPDTSPTPGEFYGGVERWCPHWKTMTTATAGTISVEVLGTPGTQQLVIDWSGVSGNTFQIVFHEGTGYVEYRYAVMSLTGGGGQPILIGWTQGGGALTRAVDISAGGVPSTFSTQAVDNTPLHIETDARPQLGTNPNYVISGYHAASTPFAFLILDTNPQLNGIALAGLGLPDCFQYVGANLGQLQGVIFLPTGGAAQVTRALVPGGIPNIPAFNGVAIFAQAASFTGLCAGGPCNPLGVLTSDGLRVFFGSL